MKNPAKKASKSGAKKKPMRVWVITYEGQIDHKTVWDDRKSAQSRASFMNGWARGGPFRVVEFREHRPARKARGGRG